jgi:predicted aconitase with swiveling domain
MDGSGRILAPGVAAGIVVRLDRPLSLWGGFDPRTGVVVDGRHPQTGVCLTGLVVAMPGGKGSSSSSSVLAEAIRAGTAPAAFVLGEADPIIALGSIVASELYGRGIPVVVLDEAAFAALPEGATVEIEAAGDPPVVRLR